MSVTRNALFEALDPLIQVRNKIINSIKPREIRVILGFPKFCNEIYTFLDLICEEYSNKYNKLSDEDKYTVIEDIFNHIRKIYNNTYRENTDNLEQKIYEFLKFNNGNTYPLESTAKKLADYIKNNK
jgi:predicted metallopeptidase